MSKNNLGDIKMGFGRADASGFGLGFQVELDLGRSGTLGSEGEYSWGGAAGTRFWIDPSDRVIGIYMIQILPHTGLTFGNEFKVLAEQALVTSGRPIPARVRRTPAVIRGTRPPVR